MTYDDFRRALSTKEGYRGWTVQWHGLGSLEMAKGNNRVKIHEGARRDDWTEYVGARMQAAIDAIEEAELG